MIEILIITEKEYKSNQSFNEGDLFESGKLFLDFVEM